MRLKRNPGRFSSFTHSVKLFEWDCPVSHDSTLIRLNYWTNLWLYSRTILSLPSVKLLASPLVSCVAWFFLLPSLCNLFLILFHSKNKGNWWTYLLSLLFLFLLCKLMNYFLFLLSRIFLPWTRVELFLNLVKPILSLYEWDWLRPR